MTARTPNGRTVTTRDIAEALNVSVSTVGRALAQDPRISTATRERVTRMAHEMGYAGNVAARMMRGASSNVVGLLIPDIRNSFYSTVAHALSRCLSHTSFQIMLSETGDDPGRELAQIRGMAATRAAGVITVPTSDPARESIRLLHAVPHVQLLRHDRRLGSQWFGIADDAVLFDATEHLSNLGHQRIAYLGSEPTRSTGRDRHAGYLRAAEAAGLPPIVKHTQPGSVHAARAALREELDGAQPPTALVCASVRITEAVLLELDSQGIDVPGELSVVGFGDQPGFSWWGPGLTTMALPVEEVATACSVWLRERLNGSGLETPFSSTAAGVLIERGSTRRVSPWTPS